MSDDNVFWIRVTPVGDTVVTDSELEQLRTSLQDISTNTDYKVILSDGNIELLDRDDVFDLLGEAVDIDVSDLKEDADRD